MHPQLGAIINELESASVRLHALAQKVPPKHWTERCDPTRWSISECIAHLNLTAAASLPLLRDGIARARRLRNGVSRRYRRDAIGWLLWKSMGPPVRFRLKTTPPFVPTAAEPAPHLVDEFDRLQAEQLGSVVSADGLPIDRVKITSPFSARIRYNLYAALTILPRHQHRHLWQAEQTWHELGT